MKKKIILTLFLGIIFIGTIFFKADLISEKLKFKKIIAIFNNKLSVLAQELTPYMPYFIPQYPERLKYLISEIAVVNEELLNLNEEIESLMKECNSQAGQLMFNFQSLTSQMAPVEISNPCPFREKINEVRQKIEEKSNDLAFWQKTLKTEMDLGLERELKTLRPEDAAEIRDNLNKIVNFNQELISKNSNSVNLSFDFPVKINFSCLEAKLPTVCVTGGAEQIPIKLKFKAGVKLDDLELGQVKVTSFKLNLPEEIELPKLPKLSSLNIPFPDITLSFPEVPVEEVKSKNKIDLSYEQISVNVPQPSLPKLSEIKFSCPQPVGPSSAQYSSQGTATTTSNETDWYLKTFEFLSQECEKLPGMKDNWGIPANTTECFDKEGNPTTTVEGCTIIEGCYKPKAVVQTFVNICDQLWQRYFGLYKKYREGELPGQPPHPTSTCEAIGAPDSYRDEIEDYNLEDRIKTRSQSVSEKCGWLFRLERESVPETCDTNPVGTLRDKCTQIRKSGRKEIPEPCKLLPLFTGKMEVPTSEDFSGKTQNLPSTQIFDYAWSILGCPPSLPTIPKIKLPDIEIPDIILPDINLFFLQINLPDLITEDLVFPEIDLCNLDDCQNLLKELFKFPLKFSPPSLTIPPIEAPAVSLPEFQICIEGLGCVPVIPPQYRIGSIQFPSFPFILPQLSLGPLSMPELKLPEITPPKPKFFFEFAGIDFKIDILGFILGLLGVPNINYCMDLSRFQVQIPFRIGFPDFYLSWPAFPRIPENFFCKDINKYCYDMKSSLKKSNLTDKIGDIEKQINQIFNKEIQSRLNQLSPLIAKEVQKNIQQQIIGKENQRITQELEKYQNALWGKVENGLVKIPPIVIPGEAIEIPEIPLNELVNKLTEVFPPWPDKIPIPWSAVLKILTLQDLVAYDLPNIPLSNLSYEKEISIDLPGFSSYNLDYTTSGINFNNCQGLSPTFNLSPFQSNLGRIEILNKELSDSSQIIIKILE